MKKSSTPLLGWAFNDVLNELHQLVFEGVPGESAPFELSQLEREYIAYMLACYYQCGRCLEFHDRAVRVARRKEKSPDWNWQDELVSATLFLHLDGRKLSDLEWQHGIRPYARVRDDEVQQIHDALKLNYGNKTRAAISLGLTPRQLRYRMKKLEIETAY